MLTATAMTGFKNHVKQTVAFAKYKVGNTWYDASALNIYEDSAGKVAIDFQVDPEQAGTVTVAGVRIYNTAGEIWLEKADSIVRKDTQEGIFYRFTVEIREV